MSDDFSVNLPGGGSIFLHNAGEVDRWETLQKDYMEEYAITKVNDRAMLGTLLQQHILLYRAQVRLSGVEAEVDEEQLPTGRTIRRELKPAEISRWSDEVSSASKEIRDIEKALGIDKKSRESGGEQTIRTYIEGLKEIGHKYGIHVAERVIAYEEFTNELRWRVRLVENGDAEDIAYHECSPEQIVNWSRAELGHLEEVDEKFAREVQALVVGKL